MATVDQANVFLTSLFGDQVISNYTMNYLLNLP